MLKEQNILTSNAFLIAVGVLCLAMGKLITMTPMAVPVVLLVGVFIFLLAVSSSNLAMTLLILAMLLSPELSLGAVNRQRAVVIRVEDVLIGVLSIVWLARTAVSGKMGLIPKTPLNRFIGMYVAFFTLSTILGMTSVRLRPLTGTFYILKYLEYFLIYYLVAGTLRHKRQVVLYLKAFIITFALVNIYAASQIGHAGRVSAPFEGEIGEPNTLGGYQILLLAVILGLLTHMRKMRWRWPLIALAVFSLVPFAYTLSRSSYMAMIPMYGTLIFFHHRRTRNILIGVMIIAVILSFFFFPQNIKDRIRYTFTPQEQETIKPFEIAGVALGPSASARLWDWLRLYHKWRQRPYLGYGVTGAGFVDSQFIRTLVELGLFGFAAFVGLLWTIFRVTLRIYRRARDDLYKGLALGFLAGHIGMVAHAVTANTFILIRIMEPYWFLAAMVMMIPGLEAAGTKISTDVVPSASGTSATSRDALPRNTDLLVATSRR